MEIVSINKASEKSSNKHKEELLEVLEVIKQMVESGEIDEFAAASSGSEGSVQIHVAVKDLLGGVGLFEIGKKMLIDQQEML